MADGRFPFLSLILGLISNLIAYFQGNLALLIFKLIFPGCGRTLSGYFRYRCQEAEGWISLSLTLFCPDFDILVCFCDFEERHNNISPHQRNSKMAPICYFAAHNSKHVCVKHAQSCKLTFSEIDLSYTYGQAKTLRSYEWR